MRPFRDTLVAWFLGLLAITAACLVLIGCHAPTAPDYAGPHFRFTGVAISADDAAWAEGEWETQAACVHFTGRQVEALEVEVLGGGFLCPVGGQGVYAAGCTELGKIEVGLPWFRPALSHELIHYLTMRMGLAPDAGHEGAIWAQCDRLNR